MFLAKDHRRSTTRAFINAFINARSVYFNTGDLNRAKVNTAKLVRKKLLQKPKNSGLDSLWVHLSSSIKVIVIFDQYLILSRNEARRPC